MSLFNYITWVRIRFVMELIFRWGWSHNQTTTTASILSLTWTWVEGAELGVGIFALAWMSSVCLWDEDVSGTDNAVYAAGTGAWRPFSPLGPYAVICGRIVQGVSHSSDITWLLGRLNSTTTHCLFNNLFGPTAKKTLRALRY